MAVALYSSDPAYTRLFFSPTAYTLGRGSALFSVYQVFLPSFTLGLSESFDLAAGVSLLPGTKDQFLYVAPKLGFFRSRGVAVAAGGLFVSSLRGGGGGGLAYGVFTVGRRGSLLSLGFAIPFYETDILSPGGYLFRRKPSCFS